MANIFISDFYRDYRFERKLGEGSFGEVSKFTHSKTKVSYAVKQLRVTSKEKLKDGVREILAMIKLKHHLVVKIHQFYHGQRKLPILKSSLELGIIMELGQCSLQDLIAKAIRQQTFLQLSKIMRFATEFIHFFALLEKHKISHRDIKPANFIVIDEQMFICKLADFGLCKEEFEGPYRKKRSENQGYVGSFYYSSPQQRQRFLNPQSTHPNNLVKNDVYSLGVTLFQMATNELPYSDQPFCLKQLFARLNSSQGNFQSELLAELLRLMLQQDEEARPTFIQLSRTIQEAMASQRQVQNYDCLNLVSVPSSEDIEFGSEVCTGIDRDQLALVRSDSVSSSVSSRSNTSSISKKFSINTVNKIQTGLQIQTIKACGQFVFLGTSLGELKVLYNQKIYNLKSGHTKTISSIEQISQKQLWTAGCDNKVLVWNLQKLKAIIPLVQPKKVTKKSLLFKTAKQETTYPVEEDNLFQELAGIPKQKHGISHIKRHTGFTVIGYHDGHIHIKRDNLQPLDLKPHTSSVCGSVFFTTDNMKGYLMTAGYDGIVRRIRTDSWTLQSIFFAADSSILAISKFSNSPLLGLACVSGNVVICDPEFNVMHSAFVEGSTLLGVCFYYHGEAGNAMLTLGEGGELIQDQTQPVLNLQNKGIHLIEYQEQDHGLVLAGFEGQVYFIKRILQPITCV